MTNKETALLKNQGFITYLIICSDHNNIHQRIADANERLCELKSLYPYAEIADKPYSGDFINICAAICNGMNYITKHYLTLPSTTVCDHCWIGRTLEEEEYGVNADKSHCVYCGIREVDLAPGRPKAGSGGAEVKA